MDCIVCQVNQSVLHVLNCVLFAGRPQVAILIEVALQISVNRSGDRVESYIEFPILVEQRLLAVFLDDVASLFAIDHIIRDDLPDL